MQYITKWILEEWILPTLKWEDTKALRLALQIKCTSLHAIDMSDIRDEINCFLFQMKLKLNKIKSVSSLVENHCLILIVQRKCQENDTR